MWKSKGLSDEIIKSPVTSGNSLPPSLNHIGFRLRIKLDGQCLKRDKVTFNYKTTVNIYIVFEITLQPFKQSVNVQDMILDLMHVQVFLI